MMTIPQMKRHVSTLLDTRHSLVAELESSRREAGELDHECDALRREMQTLEGEVRCMKTARVAPATHDRDTDELRSRLAAQRRQVRSLVQERDAVVHRAAAVKRQLSSAVEDARELSAKYRRTEARRDDAKQRLDDAMTALAEVRNYLVRSLAHDERHAPQV